MVNRAVFLDRDGVINRAEVRDGKPYAPRKIEDFIILPGVDDAIVNINALGYLVVVVTNQPDINNELVDPREIDAMHDRLSHLPIKKVYICPHTSYENCFCRKPKPGMLFRARDELDINLSDSYMVGDRQSDVQASVAAGCKSIFIDYGYRETGLQNPDYICDNLCDFYQYLLGAVNDR